MKKLYKIIIIVIFILVIIFGTGYFLFMRSIKSIDIPMATNEYVIEFSELQEKVHIRAKTWGIGGNHEEIILSTAPIKNKHREYFRDEQYIFFSPELYYKKEGIDSLFLYVVHKTDIPKNISTQIKIIQVELQTPSKIKEYNMHYKEYGLTKVSVYNKGSL